MKRLQLRNSTHAIEFPDTPEGMMEAIAYRATHSTFKRRRIRSILQLAPSQVPTGEKYLLTYAH